MSFNIPTSRFVFEAVSGYFVFTNPSVANDTLPAIASNFGLENSRTWKEMQDEIKTLNAQAAHTKQHYKLVYVARHGEGSHNVAEAKYGTQAWDAHWSLLTGDGESTWGPDPALTAVGEGQALDAGKAWKRLLTADDVHDRPPMPTRFFVSPMVRAARTLELTYDGIAWHAAAAAGVSSQQATALLAPVEEKPIILECLREDFHDRHTCDERSARSTVARRWEPHGWRIEGPMDEDDTLFASQYKESREKISERLADALGVIWQRAEGHDVINITAHSGAMQALFRAVKHDDFKPKTGGELFHREFGLDLCTNKPTAMVPMLIRATERKL